MVENIVFSQFLKKDISHIKYWRTINDAEVDFIPVEVKYTTFISSKLGRSFMNFVNYLWSKDPKASCFIASSNDDSSTGFKR